MTNQLRTRRAALTALGLATLATCMTACSYTSGLLPSVGVNPDVYYASANVLTEKDVAIWVLPECTLGTDGKTQTCTGKTLDSQPITVVADQTDKTLPMTIKVGDTVIFTGSATDELAKAATQ